MISRDNVLYVGGWREGGGGGGGGVNPLLSLGNEAVPQTLTGKAKWGSLESRGGRGSVIMSIQADVVERPRKNVN